jgi:hypothetical protein
VRSHGARFIDGGQRDPLQQTNPGLGVSDPPTQAELQSIASKLDERSDALPRPVVR